MLKFKRFGLPYQGSKNSIATWIVDLLPPADTFCDLFCGGCAVTHAAMVSGKYNHFIINDIRQGIPELFVDCCNGKYTIKTHTEWISREKFHAEKNKNAYIALCWSFGNNGSNYIYGKDKEEIKKALHDAVFFNNLSGFEKLGINLTKSDYEDIYKRYSYYRKQLEELTKKIIRLQSLGRLQSLQNLANLQSLERLESLQNLERFVGDYQQVQIPRGSVIYCDIPYKGTCCKSYSGFDHDRFYEWAERQNNIYISEYSMPPEFIKIAEKQKTVLSSGDGGGQKATECIFTNRRTAQLLRRIK